MRPWHEKRAGVFTEVASFHSPEVKCGQTTVERYFPIAEQEYASRQVILPGQRFSFPVRLVFKPACGKFWKIAGCGFLGWK